MHISKFVTYGVSGFELHATKGQVMLGRTKMQEFRKKEMN